MQYEPAYWPNYPLSQHLQCYEQINRVKCYNSILLRIMNFPEHPLHFICSYYSPSHNGNSMYSSRYSVVAFKSWSLEKVMHKMRQMTKQECYINKAYDVSCEVSFSYC